MAEESARPRPDEAIARIAANQHGVISFRQLTRAGIDRNGVHSRLRSGRLHRIHRGVYAVGHPGLSQKGKWKAAVLACGDRAVLSHRAAGALWQILTPPNPARALAVAEPVGCLIDVTVPGDGGRKRRDGLRIHRSATLLPSHCTLRDAIPVTKPSRTLEDLRRVLPREEFVQALREAQYLRMPIGDHFNPDRSRTRLEGRFLVLCRRHRLPKPEVNVRVDRFKVDFLWREARLVAEVDGWEGHRMRSAFEEDRARDARLTLLGYTVVRFTWRQLSDEPKAVAATVRALHQAAARAPAAARHRRSTAG